MSPFGYTDVTEVTEQTKKQKRRRWHGLQDPGLWLMQIEQRLRGIDRAAYNRHASTIQIPKKGNRWEGGPGRTGDLDRAG